MNALRALLVLLALISPMLALDIMFPAGSRVGLAPPPGMTLSRNFFGFEDQTNNVILMINTLPPEAYAELARSMTPDTLRKQGLTFEKRESHNLVTGPAFLVITHQKVEKVKLRKWIFVAEAPDLTALVTIQIPDAADKAYPENAIRAALSTVAVRPSVPVQEQLGLLPFRVNELAQFRVSGVIAGRAIMLTDAATDVPGPDVDSHLVVAIAPGGPGPGGNRDTFARDVFNTIPNLKDVRINSSEPLRISGQHGHQVMATGKDVRTNNDINIVQWLRFGGGAYLHLIGIARTDAWLPAYARFRQVRDGIELR